MVQTGEPLTEDGATAGPPLGILGAAAVAMASAAFLLAVVGVLAKLGMPPETLLRDPAATYLYWPFAGTLSHLGVFALGAGASIAIFASFHTQREARLLRAFGAFSLLLAADDFFMLHEHFWVNRGVPERAVFAAYALVGLALVAGFRRSLSGVRHGGFWLACGLLAASLVADQVTDNGRAATIVEDCLKLMGLCLWSAYWISRAGAAIRRR